MVFIPLGGWAATLVKVPGPFVDGGRFVAVRSSAETQGVTNTGNSPFVCNV